MIKVTNQEEFEKCCKLMNSVDEESRLLGWSLIQDCMEIPENLCIRVLTPTFVEDYVFTAYITARLHWNTDIKNGHLLSNLVFKGKYKYRNQLATLVINERTSQ